MRCPCSSRLGERGWLLALALALWPAGAQAQAYRYHYVSLAEVELPSGFIFFDPIAMSNGRHVYGNAYREGPPDGPLVPYVSVYRNGALTIFQPGIVYTASEDGTVGGSVLTDPDNFLEQAALFRRDRVEIIPRWPGEISSFVSAMNDSGAALVVSYDSSFQQSLLLYSHGRLTQLDFGPTVLNPSMLAINNHGTISGTQGPTILDHATGFRFDPRTGDVQILEPVQVAPPDPIEVAWALGINQRGDVLGYSFVNTKKERIGIWDRDGVFTTYFVEGTPEFPTVSGRLLFNDSGLIVITLGGYPSFDRNSYLVPEPGVRLNLADLVYDEPPDTPPLWFINDLNNHGDMIGYTFGGGSFLLERTGRGLP